MPRTLQAGLLGIALISTLAGAVLSVLPAVIVGLVNLFYNSAGGVLILLGSLISLLPHPVISGPGTSSSLPQFQVLNTGTWMVLLRSAATTALCAVAFTVIVVSRRSPTRPAWATAEVCCVLAAASGRPLLWVLIPALVVGACHLLVGPGRN